MLIDWFFIVMCEVDMFYDMFVDMEGWVMLLDVVVWFVDYFLLSVEVLCCGGCVLCNFVISIEVLVVVFLLVDDMMCVCGWLICLQDDFVGWCY